MPPKNKKKQQPRNAFFYFMIERQQQFERNGRHFSGGLRDVANAVSHEWDAMSAAQRAPYETLAQKEKGRHGERYTTQGETYEEVDRKEQEKKDREAAKLESINNFLIVQGRNTGLATANFFFLHMNYYCQKESDYYPAEIALARYSIKEGIDQADVYHKFLDFGCLPLGLAHKAQQHREESHMIPAPPLPPHLNPEFNVVTVFAELHDFVGDRLDDGFLPPFYTRAKWVPSVESMLGQLARDNGHDEPDYFRVFPIEQLFFDIKNFSLKPVGERLYVDTKLDSGFPFKSFSDNILEEDKFSYKLHIACEFHEEADRVQHCSRSFVIRWGWHFSNCLCANMDVAMVLNRHCPADTDLSACSIVPERRPEVEVATSDQSWSQVPTRHVRASTGAISRVVNTGNSRIPASLSQPTAPLSHPPAPARTAAQAITLEQVPKPAPPNAWTANKPKEDYVPLRKPKTQSKAMTLAPATASGGLDYATAGGAAAGGAIFNPADFPAMGRGQGLGAGRAVGMGRGRVLRPASAPVQQPAAAQPAWGAAAKDPTKEEEEEMRRHMETLFIDEYARRD